jgi:hypothetical protein
MRKVFAIAVVVFSAAAIASGQEQGALIYEGPEVV